MVVFGEVYYAEVIQSENKNPVSDESFTGKNR